MGDGVLTLALVHRAQGKRLQARLEATAAVESLTNAVGPGHPATREAIALETALKD